METQRMILKICFNPFGKRREERRNVFKYSVTNIGSKIIINAFVDNCIDICSCIDLLHARDIRGFL